MINSVRNTVLATLNKNNYGYVSPSDFNLWAKLAQLELFEGLFSIFNDAVNKENARLSGTEYADLKKITEEAIDLFSVTKPLSLPTGQAVNVYSLPSLTTTGDQAHLINKVLSYVTVLASGASTAVTVGLDGIVDGAATFETDGVIVGDMVSFVIAGTTYVEEVLSVTETILLLTTTLLATAPVDYVVFAAASREMERVSHSKIHLLNQSNLTTPKVGYPAYTMEELYLKAFPKEIVEVGRVIAQYIRYPKDPKWTYVSLTGGTPVFDQSQSDYQDFELPIDYEASLVNKILEYSGISIREIPVVQFAKSNEDPIPE